MSHEQTIWEYRVLLNLSAEALDDLGRDGWELVGVDNGAFYLKRPGLSFKERVTQEQRAHYFAARDERRAGTEVSS